MVVSAPGGTLTFLFTDIEGSTRRWEEAPAEMDPALARHDAIVRAAIERNGGRVFKTIGDAFCSAFDRADRAAMAALDAQRDLAQVDFSAVDGLRVRMAIHTGTTIARDDDFFGPTVNRVARLLAIANGGQTLLSSVAAALVREARLDGVQLDDLGEHELKDVRAAERVFALSAPGLLRDFPPLRAARTMPSNLPFATSSFVGRDDDVARLTAELARSRLVTLVGTGGIGKTRCAVVVAAAAAARFEHGVRLVELASVADSHLVANVIAGAFDIPLSGGEPAVETLVRALQSRNVLLVLDNCEHVVAAVAPVVDRILRHCPDATVFATSREPLNLRGESVYRLPSLSVPPERAPRTAREAMTYGAVALFVHRAVAARPEFVFDDETVAAVSAICRRLDGIALAIELAAIRLRAIGVDDLLERLNRRFRLLKSGSRTDLPRQQTMRALVDWSYDLLDVAEQRTFRRLSIFANRFDLDGALDACASDAGDSDDDALDLLESLVDKSLVAVDRDDRDGERPYRLLETLREYAHEKLVESGEADATYRRLARRCLVRAQASDAGWARDASAAWRRAFETELDDVRAALAWALERHGDVALGMELAAASRRGWSSVAPAEGRTWMLLARDALDENAPRAAAARIWLAVAHVHVALGQHASALEAARRAAEAFGTGHPAERFEADSFAGFSLALLGEIPAAKELLGPALAGFESMGLEHLAAVAATDLAAAHVYAEEFDDARRLFREALARFRRFSDDGGLDAVTINLSELEFRSGDAATAIRLTADAIADRADDAPILMLANMAAYLCAIDRFDEARAYGRDGLARAEATGQDVDVAFSIQHLAAIAALETHPDAPAAGATFACAARLFGFVDAALVTLASAREFTEQREYDRARAALVAGLGRDAVEAAFRDGASQSRRLAIAEAIRL